MRRVELIKWNVELSRLPAHRGRLGASRAAGLIAEGVGCQGH